MGKPTWQSTGDPILAYYEYDTPDYWDAVHFDNEYFEHQQKQKAKRRTAKAKQYAADLKVAKQLIERNKQLAKQRLQASKARNARLETQRLRAVSNRTIAKQRLRATKERQRLEALEMAAVTKARMARWKGTSLDTTKPIRKGFAKPMSKPFWMKRTKGFTKPMNKPFWM